MKKIYFFIKGYSFFFKLYRFIKKYKKRRKVIVKKFLKFYNKRTYGNAYYMRYYLFQRLQTRKKNSVT